MISYSKCGAFVFALESQCCDKCTKKFHVEILAFVFKKIQLKDISLSSILLGPTITHLLLCINTFSELPSLCNHHP